jgi:serine/threonine protein kinase
MCYLLAPPFQVFDFFPSSDPGSIKGGELFDQIEKAVYYSEQSGAMIISAICAAIKHCHAKNVLHRDLKVYQETKSFYREEDWVFGIRKFTFK